ncbi:aryl-sulfate sulfotransferase [Chitinophaga lutea]
MKRYATLLLLILCWGCQGPEKMTIPYWVQEALQLDCPAPEQLPAPFKDGYVLISRRDEPGMLYLVDHRGEVAWYHQVQGTGFKTAHFTEDQTILGILGTKDYATSYGNELLEVSLTGDTLLHLRKGQADFADNAHHEALIAPHRHIALLTSVQRTFDLRSKGGGPADTVKSDGILVLDRQGRKVWQWTVFDALDPLDDADIRQTRSDWMHANSLCYDRDGHFLISFYNNGQIWKINAHTGEVMWKFGRGGDFPLTGSAAFDMGHAVHRNASGDLMLFDNGVSRQQSQALAFDLDEQAHHAGLTFRVPLPAHLFNDRMGSAYLVGENHVLSCASKRNTVVLTDKRGMPVWTLRCAFIPYRAEFIPASALPAAFSTK